MTVATADRVLAVGGVTASGTIAGAELYDPASNTWSATTSPLTPRLEHVMVKLSDGTVLIAGGTTGRDFLNTTETYNPVTAVWTARGNLNTDRRFASAERLPNGRVLIAGGWTQGTNDFTSGAEVYNPATSAWTNTGSMSTARGQFSTVMLKSGKILAAGGASSTGAAANLSSAEKYDYVATTWSSAGSMGTARTFAAIARTPFNQRVIVSGGSTTGSTSPTATADLYDPTSNTWAAAPSMSTARIGAAFAQLPGSRLLVAGGSDGSSGITSVESWDAITASWTTETSLGSPRSDSPMSLFFADVWRAMVSGYSVTGVNSAELRSPDGPAGETDSPYAVNVDWSNTNLTGTLTAATTIAGVAKNVGSTSLSVQLFSRAFGLDQRTVRRSIGTYTIAAGGTKNFTIAVSAIPIQSIGMQSQVQLEAKYTPTGGTATVVVSPPVYYKFVSGYGSATFTGWSAADDAVTTPAGTASPFARALQSVRVSAAPVHTLTGQFWNGSTFTAYTATTATTKGSYYFRDPRHAEYDVNHPAPSGAGDPMPVGGSIRICSTWRGQFQDGGKGEAYGNSTGPVDYSAIRSRFLVTSTTTDAPVLFTDFLGAGGCTGYMVMPPGNYLFFQDTFLQNGSTINVVYGGWDPRVIGIPFNGIPSSADPNFAGSEEEFAPYNASVATGFTVPNTANGETLNLTPSYTDMAIRSAAVMSLVLETPDNGVSGVGDPVVAYRVVSNKTCPNSPSEGDKPIREACGFPGKARLYLGPTLDKKSHTSFSKITIGHEFGHVVQDVNIGLQQLRYGVNPAEDQRCRCDHITGSGSNDIHCLQSKQALGATQAEGFAQFYASRVWNDPTSASCTFAYYKKFKNPDLTVTSPPVVKSCKNAIGSNPKWMITYCDGTDKGTEYDWMLFLYAINTSAGTDKTTFASLRDIMKTMCSGSTSFKCTDNDAVTWNGVKGMRPAAEAVYGGTLGARYIKFANTAVDTGVNR